MKFLKHNIRTKIAGLLILSAVLYGQFSQQQWNNAGAVIMSDVNGYYAYLPALFIHDDLKLEDPGKFAGEVWYLENEQGTRYIKYTCGMAIVYSPFFLLANTFAESLGAPADGYSYPYKFALAMSAVVYLLIGLVFLSKLLLLYFRDRVVAITLLILYAGTNALQYYTVTMTFSHGYSLALIAVFLYCAVRWLSVPKWKYAIAMGLTAGLFTLIRPIDVLFVLALPLLNLHSFKDLGRRFITFWERKAQVVVMLVGFGLMLLPQLLYFKLISGSYLFFSYTGESFFFGNPHLFDSLLSYRNGWLVYSPLMLFSIVGFFLMRKQPMRFGTYLIPVVLIYYYIIASWWCWWYPGFGNRAYINLYPLLSIPLAFAVHYILSRKTWFVREGFKLIVLLGVVLSVFQTYQYAAGTLHWGAMTKDAYWDTFFRVKPSQLYETYLRHPIDPAQIAGRDVIYEPTRHQKYVLNYDFETGSPVDSTMIPFMQSGGAYQGKRALHIDEGPEFVLSVPVPIVDDLSAIYISGWVKSPPRGLTFVLSKIEPVEFYYSSEEVFRSDGDWQQIHMLAWIPEGLAIDSLDFYIWNPWKEAFILDDLRIEGVQYTYEEKER